MRIKLTGFTRRPAFLALLAAGCMVYLAIYKFDIPAGDVGQAALISILLILAIALPAGLLVAVIKLVKQKRNKE